MYQYQKSMRLLPRIASLIRSDLVPRLDLVNNHLIKPRTMASNTRIPEKMRGILIEKTGGTEVLQYKTDLPVPSPKEGEILVKNDFIGINYIDTYKPFVAST